MAPPAWVNTAQNANTTKSGHKQVADPKAAVVNGEAAPIKLVCVEVPTTKWENQRIKLKIPPPSNKPVPVLKHHSGQPDRGVLNQAGYYGEIKSMNQQRDPETGGWRVNWLRQSDPIVHAQYGTNLFSSAKGITGFGTARDVKGVHMHNLAHDDPTIAPRQKALIEADNVIPAQYGSNKYASRKGGTEYGAGRDVVGKHLHRLLDDPEADPEEIGKLRLSDTVINAQYGSNKFASRKGMSEYGAPRDVMGNHLHSLMEDQDTTTDEEKLRQTEGIIPKLAGRKTVDCANRSGMTDFGMGRDVKGIHLHRMEDDPDIAQTIPEGKQRSTDHIIPKTSGSNAYESQKGMTAYGAPRDVHGPHLHHWTDADYHPNLDASLMIKSDGIIPWQYGTNEFASRKGMSEYGMPRDVKGIHIHHAFDDADYKGKMDESTLRKSDAIIPWQYGTNQYDSQKGMTDYGMPRDVKGKHLHNSFKDDPVARKWFTEDDYRKAEGVIPWQYGTNQFASRKGMTEYGAPRDVKGFHLHRFSEDPNHKEISDLKYRECDGVIPWQYGSNQFASRKGMSEYGATRDVKGTHLHFLWKEDPGVQAHFDVDKVREESEREVHAQYGSNKFASQKGMTKFGTPRDVAGRDSHELMKSHSFTHSLTRPAIFAGKSAE